MAISKDFVTKNGLQVQGGGASINGAANVAGLVTVTGNVIANQFQSTIPNGNAPLQVQSNTVVGNLSVTYISGVPIANIAQLTGANFTGNIATTGLANVNTLNVVGNAVFGGNITFGNSIANVTANSIIFQIANASGIANLSPTQLVIGTSKVNTSVISEGANVLITTTGITIGNSTVNTVANSSTINTGTISISTGSVSGNLTVSGSLTVNGILIESTLPSATSIASLRSFNITGLSNGVYIYVDQYYAGGNKKGGGYFQLTNVSPGTENGGTWIASSNTGWYWSRVIGDESVQLSWFGAVGNGSSIPLSTFYASNTAAQAIYPHAVNTLDEVDWAAAQAAFNYIYFRDTLVGATFNSSCGRVVAQGQYLWNRTVTSNILSVIFEGITPPLHQNIIGATSITYNGSAGTVDAPIYLFDSYVMTEPGVAPPGKLGNTGQTQNKTVIKNIQFNGLGGSLTGNTSVSGYISGIRLRGGLFSHVEDCAFGGTLWDGITYTGIQLFAKANQNFFYGVQRDAISICHTKATFSTTVWIEENEFGVVGRYSIYMNCLGGPSQACRVHNNDFEGNYNSIFVQNPQWFFSGVVATTCFAGINELVMTENRFETATDSLSGFWADVHIVQSSQVKIADSDSRNLVCTTLSAAQAFTTALTSYLNTNYFSDLTDQRNYNIGTHSDFNTECAIIQLDNLSNLNKIFVADNTGITSSNMNSMRGISGTLSFFSVPTTAGTYATLMQPRTTAVPTLIQSKGNWIVENCTIIDLSYSCKTCKHFYKSSAQAGVDHGDYIIFGPHEAYTQWVANTTYTNLLQTQNLDPFVYPLTENGFVYQCTTAGKSGLSEPVWPLTVGGTVSDNTITWTCIGYTAYETDNNTVEWQEAGIRRRFGSVAPTQGIWFTKEKILLSPSTGGVEGFICIGGGTPGTWNTFGLINPNVSITTTSLIVGNSTVNTFANSSVVNTGTFNASVSANVGANVHLTTTALSIGNSTVNITSNSILLQIANSSGTANLQPTQLVIGTSTINSTAFAQGANVFVTTTSLTVGNSTVNTFANSSVVNTGTFNLSVGSNIGANVLLTTSTITIGNSTVNTFANSSVVNTGTFNASVSANVGANVHLTTTALSIGNSTVNTFANSVIVQVASSSGTANLTPTTLVVGSTSVNSSSIKVSGGGWTPANTISQSSSTLTINCLLSNVFRVAMGASVSTVTVNNPNDGQTICIMFIQDGSGSRTISWPGTFKWAGGVAGVLSTAANAKDLLTITYDATDSIWFASLSLAFG